MNTVGMEVMQYDFLIHTVAVSMYRYSVFNFN